MDLARRNNVTLHGRPQAPAMVLLHGFGCDQGMWRLVVPSFTDSYRVVLLDHVGAGGSDLSAHDPVRHATLQGYADDLVEVLDELALGPAIVVGHSVSAMISVLVAVQRPDLVARLVMVCPSPRYTDDGAYRGGFTAEGITELLETMDSNYLGWSASMAPVIMGAPDRPELSGELAGSFCRTDPGIARQFARATFLADNRADLARVTAPCLVVDCRRDVIAPPEVGRFVADQIPDCSLVTLDVVGHCPNLSAPDLLVAVMLDHLQGVAV